MRSGMWVEKFLSHMTDLTSSSTRDSEHVTRTLFPIIPTLQFLYLRGPVDFLFVFRIGGWFTTEFKTEVIG